MKPILTTVARMWSCGRAFGYDGGMETQPEGVAAAKPKRRWFQFSLATLLLLTLLWVASAADRRRLAVAYVRSLDGQVGYAAGYKEGLSAPERFRRSLGDYFQSVKQVYLRDTQVSDAGVGELEAAFPNCEIWN